MDEKLGQLSDEQLVSRYADGCNEAFDIILCRYKRKVFSYIMLSVKDYDVANDIFQDVFIKAISTIRQGFYIEKGKFAAWLMRITHNLVIDHFRRQSAVELVSGDNADEDETPVFDTVQLYDDSVEDKMIEGQVYKDVQGLMKMLPESQREVLKMRFFQDLSFKEIADATGVSINTALGRMRYALLNLRRLADEHNISMNI